LKIVPIFSPRCFLQALKKSKYIVQGRMTLWLYGAVTRGQVVLAECVFSDGNFDVATAHFLLQLDPGERVMSFADQAFRYFFLQTESGLTFVVVGYSSTHPRRALALLDQVATAFTADPATAGWKDATHLGLQGEFGGRLRQLLASPDANRQSEALLQPGNVLQSLGPEGLAEQVRQPRPRGCRFSTWVLAVAGLLALVLVAAAIAMAASGR
jgi:hypothetical protein